MPGAEFNIGRLAIGKVKMTVAEPGTKGSTAHQRGFHEIPSR
jgi:hypothetical protein